MKQQKNKKGEAFRKGFLAGVEETREEIKSDMQSILNFLEGDTPRKKIINYIKQYLLMEK